MIDLNRHEIPPGGWQFYQAQTGWKAPTPISSTFDQTVMLIIKHRKANPAVVKKHNLSLDVYEVGVELETYNRKRLGIPDLTELPKTLPRQADAQPVGGAVVAAVKKLASGAALLMEWEESKENPVAHELAESRAAVCAVCPKNDKAPLSEWFTVPISEVMRKRFQKLREMNLTTSKDAELNVCTACLCPLKLKVHSPLHLIVKRLKPEMWTELDPNCWIPKENT